MARKNKIFGKRNGLVKGKIVDYGQVLREDKEDNRPIFIINL